MTISMYQVSVPVFTRHLGALGGIVDKAADFAEARKVDPAVLLATRLYPNTFGLNVQVAQVCTHATRGVSELAGLTQPDYGPPDITFGALKERVTKARDFVKSVTPAQIDGTEDKDIILKFGAREMAFKGQAFLVGFTLPNFFFHYSTTYNILRGMGLEVAKRDFMGPIRANP